MYSVLVFKTGFSKECIEDLTYTEAFNLVASYYKMKLEDTEDLLDQFVSYGLQVVSMATHGKAQAQDNFLRRFKRNLRRNEEPEDKKVRELNRLFEESDFG